MRLIRLVWYQTNNNFTLCAKNSVYSHESSCHTFFSLIFSEFHITAKPHTINSNLGRQVLSERFTKYIIISLEYYT